MLVGIGVRDLGPVTIADSWVFRWHFLFRTLGMLKARQLVSSPTFQHNLLPHPRNDAVLAAIGQRPDRFLGFAFINPESAQAAQELQRCLALGMCGLKLALVQYPTDLGGGKMVALCEIAAGHGIPVFMHLGLTAASSRADAWLRPFQSSGSSSPMPGYNVSPKSWLWPAAATTYLSTPPATSPPPARFGSCAPS